jgi:hypothetical protein
MVRILCKRLNLYFVFILFIIFYVFIVKRVAVKESADYVFIVKQDTGIGMDKNHNVSLESVTSSSSLT